MPPTFGALPASAALDTPLLVIDISHPFSQDFVQDGSRPRDFLSSSYWFLDAAARDNSLLLLATLNHALTLQTQAVYFFTTSPSRFARS